MIRLQEATLLQFGKFHDYSIPFSDGFQVIYGGNEAGKSTIHLFIKTMLYGVTGNKKDSDGIKLRERIIPWNEKFAAGVLRVEVEGRQIEIRRKIGKTPAGDKVEVVEYHTGEPVFDFPYNECGESLLGVPESIFEKTFWLKQGNVAFSGQDDALSKRLTNLLETGEEEFSVREIQGFFETEKRSIQAKDKRSNPGELDNLWSLREEKMQEKYKILSERRQREAEDQLLAKEKERLALLSQEESKLQNLVEEQKKIQNTESRLKKWKEAERFLHLSKQAESREACQRFMSLDEELVQKAEKLEKNIETLDQTERIEYDIRMEDDGICQKERKEKFFLILGGIVTCAVCFSLILAIHSFSFWIPWTFVVLGISIAFFVFSIFRCKRLHQEIRQGKERKDALQERYREQKNDFATQENEYNQILSSYGCKNVAELREGFLLCKQSKVEAEGYRKTYETMIDGENFDNFPAEYGDIESTLRENENLLSRNLDTELSEIRHQQLECIAKIKEVESKLSYVYTDDRNPADLETEIQQINLRIAELEKRQKAIDLASEVFKVVSEKRKSDFTPRINEKIISFLGILTDEKYQDVRVSDEYKVRLLPDKAHLYQAEFFSKGTYEQVYLALRLSLLTLIGDGTEPIFLDDFLATYDDVRAEAAMRLLEELGERHQILLFTCHGRECKSAKKRNIIIRYLEEERENGC